MPDISVIRLTRMQLYDIRTQEVKVIASEKGIKNLIKRKH